MSTLFGKQDTNPKLYLTDGLLINSNQEYYYTNLEYQRKQDEHINQLANNIEKLNGEILEMIRNIQQLKDAVCADRLLQYNINQNLKKQINQNHKEISKKFDEQTECNQKIIKQISQHETVHKLFTTQLNDQKDRSERLGEQIRQTETRLTNQLENNNEKLNNKIDITVSEQQIFRDKQNDFIQDLFKQISQHEAVHDLFTTQLNDQKDSNERLSEQIREHQILKVIVDSYLLKQNKQLNLNYESIQELKKHLSNHPAMLSEQFSTNNEMIQYPFALILNMLPSNYPAKSIFVNGKQESVTAFLSVNNQEKIAFFLDDEIIKKFNYSSIDGIILGEEW